MINIGSVPLTIPNGQANSNSINASLFGQGKYYCLGSPSSLDAITFNFQVSFDGGVNWLDLVSSGSTLVTIPAAGKAQGYYTEFAGAIDLRIHAAGNVAADRTFVLSWAEESC